MDSIREAIVLRGDWRRRDRGRTLGRSSIANLHFVDKAAKLDRCREVVEDTRQDSDIVLRQAPAVNVTRNWRILESLVVVDQVFDMFRETGLIGESAGQLAVLNVVGNSTAEPE